MGEEEQQEPDEGKYMDNSYGRELTYEQIRKLYGRELTDKEFRKLAPILKDRKRYFVYSVGMNTELNKITYFRLMAEDRSTSFLVTIKDGQFRVREETEDYKKWRIDGTPLPFK